MLHGAMAKKKPKTLPIDNGSIVHIKKLDVTLKLDLGQI